MDYQNKNRLDHTSRRILPNSNRTMLHPSPLPSSFPIAYGSAHITSTPKFVIIPQNEGVISTLNTPVNDVDEEEDFFLCTPQVKIGNGTTPNLLQSSSLPLQSHVPLATNTPISLNSPEKKSCIVSPTFLKPRRNLPPMGSIGSLLHDNNFQGHKNLSELLPTKKPILFHKKEENSNKRKSEQMMLDPLDRLLVSKCSRLS
jgi:hypothetical protein